MCDKVGWEGPKCIIKFAILRAKLELALGSMVEEIYEFDYESESLNMVTD